MKKPPHNKIAWTEDMDACICRMRAAGYPWEQIKEKVGVDTKPLVRRARELGFDTSVYLNSGTMTGVQVAMGMRPVSEPFKLRWPHMGNRLGRIWRGEEFRRAYARKPKP